MPVSHSDLAAPTGTFGAAIDESRNVALLFAPNRSQSPGRERLSGQKIHAAHLCQEASHQLLSATGSVRRATLVEWECLTSTPKQSGDEFARYEP